LHGNIKRLIGIIVILVLAAVSVNFSGNQYFIDMFILTLFWAFLAGGWNIAGGFSGQFSLGHAAFLGIGAYTSSILYLNYSLSPWVGMFLGGMVSAVLAAGFVLVCSRLKGHFFALATLALGQIAYTCAVQFRALTRGAEGFHIPFEPAVQNMIFAERAGYAYLILVLEVAILLFTYWVQQSKFGYSLYAIRENENSAMALGVNRLKMKAVSFALSAFWVSIGGSFYAQYILFIEPDSIMVLNMSVEMAVIAIIGGTGVFAGPLLGAGLLVPLGMTLRSAITTIAGLDVMIYGIVLILAVMFCPEGLFVMISEKVKGKRNTFSVRCRNQWQKEGGSWS